MQHKKPARMVPPFPSSISILQIPAGVERPQAFPEYFCRVASRSQMGHFRPTYKAGGGSDGGASGGV